MRRDGGWRAARGRGPPTSLPRWGLPGRARPPALGAPAPALRAPPLTSGCGCAIMVHARPVPLLRGLPLTGYPWTAKDRSTERPGGFFMPGRFLLPGLFRCSDSGEVNRQTGPPVGVFSASEQSQNCQPAISSLLRERPIAGALDTRVPGG